MMMNQQTNSKPAGSVPTTWALQTYDVWGNARDGYDVNDVRSAGTVELRIPQTRYNIGIEWHVCRNPECPGNFRRLYHSVLPIQVRTGKGTVENPYIPSVLSDQIPHCPECHTVVALESQEFIGAYPTNRQIKLAFGVTCQIETDGDDLSIEVTRKRDGYPIGRMECTSHASLSPVRKLESAEVSR